MNGISNALQRIPLHLFGFGTPIGLAVYFYGWSGVLVLAAWRGYEEYLDYVELRDTLGKAIIDFVSQMAGAVIAGLVR